MPNPYALPLPRDAGRLYPGHMNALYDMDLIEGYQTYAHNRLVLMTAADDELAMDDAGGGEMSGVGAGPCERPKPSLRVISIDPLTTAPSWMRSRGARMSPWTIPFSWTSTLSVAVMLPATSPMTRTDFASTSAVTAPPSPTVSW